MYTFICIYIFFEHVNDNDCLFLLHHKKFKVLSLSCSNFRVQTTGTFCLDQYVFTFIFIFAF